MNTKLSSLKIVEGINLSVSIIFILLYIYRLIRIRHFAITEMHKQKYNYIRTFLCLPYLILSIPFTILLFVFLHKQDYDQKFWMILLSVGEFLDGFILIMQLIVLRLELKKERPYTNVHLTFCIYLTFVSLVRLILILIPLNQMVDNPNKQICIAFYLTFLINSVLLLGYWIAKRQQLPQFRKFNNFNIEDFHKNKTNTFYTMNCNIEISRMSKNTATFTYIRPTVLIQDGKFRITLEIAKDESVEHFLVQTQNQGGVLSTQSSKQKMKIISNKVYETNQIIELYKLCGRFTIKTKLIFSAEIGEFCRNLQAFLQQLFSDKKNYLPFCLKYFNLPESFIDGCSIALRETYKDSDFDLFTNIDKHASIISVKIFKQLWIEDHYLFYLDVLAINDRLESRPMKRYHDFETLHNQLLAVIKKRYGGKLELPSLPKKLLFNADEQKINLRRMELEVYLRSLSNDYKLMIECTEIRQLILQFLEFNIDKISTVNNQFQEYYKRIVINKGQITKKIINNEQVTFYQFKILENGTKLKFIKKRFSDFVALHQSIERWMKNIQINYKFLVLPEKHLYKSGTARHEKLKNYLQLLTKIQDVYVVYQVNAFFEVGNKTIKDITISSIDDQHRSKKFSSGSQYDSSRSRFIDAESFESKGRMSALIELLGNNQANQI